MHNFSDNPLKNQEIAYFCWVQALVTKFVKLAKKSELELEVMSFFGRK